MTTYTQGTGPFYNNGNKINGHAAAGQHLTSGMDFCTITTPVNILPATDGTEVVNGSGTDTGDSALDKLIEIVSLRGQPVIMGAPVNNNNGTYSLHFATEHMGSWDLQPYAFAGQNQGQGAAGGANAAVNSAAYLQAAIIAGGIDFGFDANTTVVFSSF